MTLCSDKEALAEELGEMPTFLLVWSVYSNNDKSLGLRGPQNLRMKQ